MPGDVTGSLVYDARTAAFEFRAGPVFTNLLLADEINRTPPKTQAALLEAMEERQVSVDGQRALPDPFIVAATQNPIEYEGTYQLPEAQLDRFPAQAQCRRRRVIRRWRSCPGTRTDSIRATCRRSGPWPVRPNWPRDARRCGRCWWPMRCSATSSTSPGPLRNSPALNPGASPRGATALLATARSWAWLSGRGYVTPDDVKAMAKPTLWHRIALRPEAELEGATADGVLDGILAAVPVPR